MSLAFSFTFLDFLVFKHAECRLKRFKRPAAVKKIDYSSLGCIKVLTPVIGSLNETKIHLFSNFWSYFQSEDRLCSTKCISSESIRAGVGKLHGLLSRRT